MESRTLISVEEYLRTVYDPDCDYVDGEVQERNLGDRDHGLIQKKLILFFAAREQQWRITVYPEQRVQISATRFRIPDVCVVLEDTEEQIFRKPPFLCIEITSPEGRMYRIRERVDDYLIMGVPHVWVLDAQHKAAYSITPADGWREEKQVLRTANPVLEMPLTAVFA